MNEVLLTYRPTIFLVKGEETRRDPRARMESCIIGTTAAAVIQPKVLSTDNDVGTVHHNLTQHAGCGYTAMAWLCFHMRHVTSFASVLLAVLASQICQPTLLHTYSNHLGREDRVRPCKDPDEANGCFPQVRDAQLRDALQPYKVAKDIVTSPPAAPRPRVRIHQAAKIFGLIICVTSSRYRRL
jgi:hypothetical protein